jgi:hypothetical protein
MARSRQVNALCEDRLGVDAKTRGLGTTVRINRYHKLGGLGKPAPQLRDQRVKYSGCLVQRNMKRARPSD